MKITLNDVEKFKDKLELLKVKPIMKINDNLWILSQSTTKRKFILGTIKCPYCDKEITLSLILQYTPGGPSIEQFLSDFINHMDNEHENFFKEWIYRSKQPYQQGSWHYVKYYVCRKCNYKSRRLADTLIHIITNHQFSIRR